MISLWTLLLVFVVLGFLGPILRGAAFIVMAGLGVIALILFTDGAAWFVRNAHTEDWIALAVILVCWIGGVVVWEMRRSRPMQGRSR